MAQVVHLKIRSQHQSEGQRQAALLESFAAHRRYGDDVFWLKENAELLNILECTGARPTADALEAHSGFYRNIEKRIGFFPQYYRFLLSMCLDLEDLGMAGNKGEAMVNRIADSGMALGELSDLQRLEARRLMLRRGRDPLPEDTGLETRMRQFINRSATFTMPNKKAAYELTHTIFYLSEYGRKDLALDPAAHDSLFFAGTLAFLDQNADLLAEICVALRYAGETPPQIWEEWLTRETHIFDVIEDGEVISDDYHEYFVCNWLMAASGRDSFAKRYAPGRLSFHRAGARPSALRAMSQCMFELDDARSGDWARMRGYVVDHLSEEAFCVLEAAEAANDKFDDFFAGFARVTLQS